MEQRPALLASHVHVPPVNDRHDDGIKVEALLRQPVFVATGAAPDRALWRATKSSTELAQPARQDGTRSRRAGPGNPRSAARAGSSRAGSTGSSGSPMTETVRASEQALPSRLFQLHGRFGVRAFSLYRLATIASSTSRSSVLAEIDRRRRRRRSASRRCRDRRHAAFRPSELP